MPILTSVPVIDPVAVADVESVPAAIPPDRELHEPRKDFRECAVELLGVDPVGNQANDVGTATLPVTALAVRMGSLEATQDPSSVQEIVHQGIDRDQLHANIEPPRANVHSANQNVG